MTAEVAILNRQGAVLAADSAVTIGGPQGKVYNTATKIHPLSHSPPIALMVYAGASFEGIPWNALADGYRRKFNDSPQDTVEEYASRLLTTYNKLLTTYQTVEMY